MAMLMEQIIHRGCLQFITHRTNRYTELQEAEMALQGGCRWIQLRMKKATPDEILKVGREMRKLCDHYEATLIVDDYVELVKEIAADGVHLGLCDMPVDEARQILGEQYIIGGTANTAEQALMHHRRSADYVGCGPFRFTETKEKLAPVLGTDGLRSIMQRLQDECVTMPVVAIGGLDWQDTVLITEAGVDGIAISGAIVSATDPVAETQRLVRLVNEQCKCAGM